MNSAALLLSFSLLSAVNAQIVPAGEPPAPPAAAESREPDSGIPETRRETRAAQRAAPETRRETRNPKPESRRPGCPAPCLATVTLVDGSVLHGTLRPRFLLARSPALGRVRIDLAAVERIEFLPSDSPAGPSAEGARSGRREGARGAAEPGRGATSPSRIAFRNGDTLTAALSSKHDRFVLETLLGPLRIPLSTVRSILFDPPHSAFGIQHSALLYHCTFDDASAISTPAAGPAGRLLGGSFASGKKGNALRVEKDAASFEAALPKGFLGPEGCIEFWAKIEGDDPRYVDGGDPLFFSLFDERGAVTLLQFAANNGFARGGLGGAIASWPFGTVAHWAGSMPYEGVLGPDWAGWHHYAMSWKAKGFGDGSFVKVFVDGRPQPVLGGVDDDKVPARLADLPNHAFLLGSPWDRSHGVNRRSKKPFLIDEFKIWKTARTEFAE